MPYIATFRGKDTRILVEEPRPNQFRVISGGTEYQVDFLESQACVISMLVGTRSFEVDVDADGDRFAVVIEGNFYDITVMEERRKKLAMKLAAGAEGRQDIRSPMAGNVIRVLVEPGDRVGQGTVLLILEAMKMQNEIRSPIDGVVADVGAREGTAVAAGDSLCVIEPIPDAEAEGSAV